MASRSLSSLARCLSKRRARRAATRERTPNHSAMSATLAGAGAASEGLPAEEVVAAGLIPPPAAAALSEVDRCPAPRLRARAAPVALFALRVVVERTRREVFVLTPARVSGPDASPAAAEVRVTAPELDDSRLAE